MGFEPTTFCLGSKHSTTELRPLENGTGMRRTRMIPQAGSVFHPPDDVASPDGPRHIAQERALYVVNAAASGGIVPL